jgi:WD40 repeat protein/DNA-binding SARP family transcriptional activator
MSHLVLSFLGGFQATLDDHPITNFESNKVRALLAYLAVEAARPPHRRESLAALLWPEFPEQAALTNLRVALSDLRAQLHDRDANSPFLLVSRETIQFNRASDVGVDVWKFEKGASSDKRNGGEQSEIENQKSAIAFYRGPFLHGFAIPDSVPFEEWLTLKREQLTQQAIRSLRQLADFYEACGDYEPALTYARRQVELEPWLEEGHRQIMRLLALSDQCSSALAQYETCKRALDEELAIEPSLETTRLYETIYAGRIEDIRLNVPLPAPGEPPFKGLQFFDEPDSPLFFGREALTQRILSQVQKMSENASEAMSLFTIIGASGSGKSSLARAGLVPALRRAGYAVQVITPGSHFTPGPSPERRGEFPPSPKGGGAGDEEILVIDQFEELFTLCHDESERQAFLDALLPPLLKGEGPGVRSGVILVLRADFYAHCAQYPRLREALCAWQDYIGPMNAAELRRAIEEPARQNNWDFEPGLVELILRDVGVSEGNPPEPGALPLLEHALLETWKRRRGRILTLKGYAEAGGVRGAIAHTAESMLLQLSADDQALVRRIFLRLTELGEGSVDTRRRVSRSELSTDMDETVPLDTLLGKLAEARLITLSAENAEVAHEALIREWPTLRQWLSEDRDALRLHRHITESAQVWERLGRDPGELYRGARLAQALEWAQDHAQELNTLERDYLQISQKLAEAEIAEREQQRQRELETALRFAESAKKLAETERQRAEEQAANSKRLRRRAWALSGALGLALLLVIATVWLAGVANTNARQANAEANTRATAEAQALAQQGTAEAERARADEQKSAALDAKATAESERGRADVAQVEAEAQRLNAEQQAALAFARELGSNANLNLGKDTELSNLLALQAISVTQNADIAPIPWDVQQPLHNVMVPWRLLSTSPEITRGVPYQVAFSPDGRRIAINEDNMYTTGIVSVRDADTWEEFFTIPAAEYFTYSPDGQLIATINLLGYDISARYKIWDAMTGQQLITLTGYTEALANMQFSPDGNFLATDSGWADQNLLIWDLTDWRAAGSPAGQTFSQPSRTFSNCVIPPAWNITFSPDGKRIAAFCDQEKTIKVWDLESGQVELTLPEQPGPAVTLRFSPNGSVLAASYFSGFVRAWDSATGNMLYQLSISEREVLMAYSPDGSMIATATPTGTVVFWDAASGRKLFELPSMDDFVTGQINFSLDGTRFAASYGRHYVRIWDVSPSGMGEMAGLALPTAQMISFEQGTPYFARGYFNGQVTLSNPDTFEEVKTLSVFTTTEEEPELWYDMKLAVGGTRLLIYAHENELAVWDTASGNKLSEFIAPGFVRNGNISPDGRLLVAGGDWGSIVFWDLSTGQELVTVTVPMPISLSLVFSPNGEYLAIAGSDSSGYFNGQAMLFDLRNGLENTTTTLLSTEDYSIRGLDFSPDGRWLASTSPTGPKVWDVATGKLRYQVDGKAIATINYSPDGAYLVTGSDLGVVQIWDAETGVELLSYSLPVQGMTLVDFFPDGRRLLVWVWNHQGGDFYQPGGVLYQLAFLNIDDLISQARSRLTRTWKPEECRKYLHSETCP